MLTWRPISARPRKLHLAAAREVIAKISSPTEQAHAFADSAKVWLRIGRSDLAATLWQGAFDLAEKEPPVVGVPLFIELSRKLKGREERDGVSPFAADTPAIRKEYQQPVETHLQTLRRAALSIIGINYKRGTQTSNPVTEQVSSFPPAWEAELSSGARAENTQAEVLLEQAETAVRALDPGGLQTLLLGDIADSWLALGQPDRARKFAQLPPANLATALARQGELREAIDIAGAIETDGQRALALSEIAAALQRFGKTERARETADEARELIRGLSAEGERSRLLAKLAPVFARLGDLNQARELADECSLADDKLAAYIGILSAIPGKPGFSLPWTGKEK